MNKYNKELNTKVFHTLERKKKYNKETKKEETVKNDILNDCLAGLFISDSSPLKDRLILCEKTDLQIDGNTHTINFLRECLCPGTDIVFDVVIDTDLCPYDAKDIIDSLNYFYEDYDSVFRSIFINEANGTVFEPQKNNDDEAYIYLGGGTGFPLKTVMYSLYEDSEEAADLISIILNQNFKSAEHKLFTERERVSPKVLKCTKYQDKLYEMGKCSISFKEKNI